MIQEILKTLSDTELFAITAQLNDENIDDNLIWAQLEAKGNKGEKMEDIVDEAMIDSFRGTLPRLLCLELSKRLLKANEMYKFSLLNPEE